MASCHSDVDSTLDVAVVCLAGILNRINWMQAKFPLKKGDKMAFKTSTCFVDHLWELFAPFLLGEPAHKVQALFVAICACTSRTLINTDVSFAARASAAAETGHKPAASAVPCIVPELKFCNA